MKLKRVIAMLVMFAVLFSATNLTAYAESNTDANATESTTEELVDATTVADVTTEAGAVSVEKKYTKAELKYMASIIFCEAGNQSYAGKLAVGIVVKNRMESKKFPNTIKKVLYQPYQFTPTRNGAFRSALAKYDKTGFKKGKAYKSSLKAAKAALNGTKSVKINGKKKSMKGYYFFSRYVSGCKLKIGAHMFK